MILLSPFILTTRKNISRPKTFPTPIVLVRYQRLDHHTQDFKRLADKTMDKVFINEGPSYEKCTTDYFKLGTLLLCQGRIFCQQDPADLQYQSP